MPKKTEAGGSERIVPYWPIDPDLLKRRQELASIIAADVAADAQRNKPSLTSLRRLELALLRTKARAARRELQRTAHERFRQQRQGLADRLESLAKKIPCKAHDIERAEQNQRAFLEHAEKAAGERGFNIGKTVAQIEAWAEKYMKEATAAAARTDQRRIELQTLKREHETVLRELAALDQKMLEVNPQ